MFRYNQATHQVEYDLDSNEYLTYRDAFFGSIERLAKEISNKESAISLVICLPITKKTFFAKKDEFTDVINDFILEKTEQYPYTFTYSENLNDFMIPFTFCMHSIVDNGDIIQLVLNRSSVIIYNLTKETGFAYVHESMLNIHKKHLIRIDNVKASDVLYVSMIIEDESYANGLSDYELWLEHIIVDNGNIRLFYSNSPSYVDNHLENIMFFFKCVNIDGCVENIVTIDNSQNFVFQRKVTDSHLFNGNIENNVLSDILPKYIEKMKNI